MPSSTNKTSKQDNTEDPARGKESAEPPKSKRHGLAMSGVKNSKVRPEPTKIEVVPADESNTHSTVGDTPGDGVCQK